MNLFRLCRSKHARDLSGEGARLFGGRWNNKGHQALYCAGSRSMAVMEVLVHLTHDEVPNDLVMVRLLLPREVAIEEVDVAKLPKNWRKFPHPVGTRAIGDRFLLAGKNMVLAVPSAIVPEERTYMVNSLHPGAKRIRVAEVKPFRLDERLLKR